MPSHRFAFIAPVLLPFLLASPVSAQTYDDGSSASQPIVREDPDTSAATAKTRKRIRAEEAKRREGVRFTDPRATRREQSYRSGRLTSEAGTYSLPVPSNDNRSVLVPQR
ncbi:hypothetical protein [Aureimonas leprariae]|uniref:Uncharacterized protein n=1 Tax=Plantimonas leprariae TaxID=2615207 RepID=A0A7V7PR31_9HYPH|nr:hypothetical protein [Aureimonas leprariae]KAB0680920.1 hypothetical protein F6X38_08040 [Aureimonas leprariae]